MNTPRRVRISLLALLVAGLAVSVLGKPASAHDPHPGLDFAISVLGGGCTTASAPASCAAVAQGDQFTLEMRIDSFADLTSFAFWETDLTYSGVTTSNGKTTAFMRTGPGFRPGCSSNAWFHYGSGVESAFACVKGAGEPDITPTDVANSNLGAGVVITQVFNCSASGSIRLQHGDSFTGMGRGSGKESEYHTEASSGDNGDVLTITCDPTLTDTDDDGCTDVKEQGSDPLLGGQRNPNSFWDFFDTPDEFNVRNKRVTGLDILRVVNRFGSDDAGGSAAINRDTDPLTLPPAEPAYHPTFDRGAVIGPDPWDLAPANGTIRGTDILAVVQQFFHRCV